jgi:hypothetical protein
MLKTIDIEDPRLSQPERHILRTIAFRLEGGAPDRTKANSLWRPLPAMPDRNGQEK